MTFKERDDYLERNYDEYKILFDQMMCWKEKAHDLQERGHLMDMCGRVVRFLEKHLGPGEKTAV